MSTQLPEDEALNLESVSFDELGRTVATGADAEETVNPELSVPLPQKRCKPAIHRPKESGRELTGAQFPEV